MPNNDPKTPQGKKSGEMKTFARTSLDRGDDSPPKDVTTAEKGLIDSHEEGKLSPKTSTHPDTYPDVPPDGSADEGMATHHDDIPHNDHPQKKDGGMGAV